MPLITIDCSSVCLRSGWDNPWNLIRRISCIFSLLGVIIVFCTLTFGQTRRNFNPVQGDGVEHQVNKNTDSLGILQTQVAVITTKLANLDEGQKELKISLDTIKLQGLSLLGAFAMWACIQLFNSLGGNVKIKGLRG